jgi:glycosyltransferase involved in cell wall biosynthesis
MQALADFANREVQVDAWISLFAHFGHVGQLRGRKAVILPDLIPLIFPQFAQEYWVDGGQFDVWRGSIERALSKCDIVITFSRHVARDHAVRLMGVPVDHVLGIPHAPPDLNSLLPLGGRRRGDTVSRRHAGGILRQEAARRGWDYLYDFPFEQTPYVAVSTQDRPTKNIGVVAEAVRLLLRRERIDLKLLITAPLHFGATWTRLPGLIERHQLQFDVVSVPHLLREAHAALYHCAALTVHASMFEGGHGPFPFYESVSVGTPCLMGRGPHVEELLEDEPELREFAFDPYDVEELVTLIRRTLVAREEALARQLGVYKRLRQRSWAQVAEEYAAAAIGDSLPATSTGRKGRRDRLFGEKIE